MSVDPTERSRAVLAWALAASGAGLVAAGIIVGLWQGPEFFLIAAIGLVDLVLAWAFHSGMLGRSSSVGEQPIPATETEPVTPDVLAGEANDDPSYNPYARED